MGRVAVGVLPELPLSGQAIIWGAPLPGQAVPVRLPAQAVGAIVGVSSLGLWAAGTVPSLGVGPAQGAGLELQHTERVSGHRDNRETSVLLGLPPHQAQARASISWEEKTEVVPPLPLL